MPRGVLHVGQIQPHDQVVAVPVVLVSQLIQGTAQTVAVEIRYPGFRSGGAVGAHSFVVDGNTLLIRG